MANTLRDAIADDIKAAVLAAEKRGLAGDELLEFVRSRTRPAWAPCEWYLRVWRQEFRYYAKGLPKRGGRPKPATSDALPGQGTLFET
jgi:hypothetical protein